MTTNRYLLVEYELGDDERVAESTRANVQKQLRAFLHRPDLEVTIATIQMPDEVDPGQFVETFRKVIETMGTVTASGTHSS